MTEETENDQVVEEAKLVERRTDELRRAQLTAQQRTEAEEEVSEAPTLQKFYWIPKKL
jgi:hypothetical protein